MKLYYLENSVATEDYKYYRNGSDCGGESYDGTGDLKYARFFLDKETAKAYIKDNTPPASYDAPNKGSWRVGFECTIPANKTTILKVELIPQR